LLQNYAKKFASSKNIDLYNYPLSFGGFCEMKKSGTNSLSSEINIKLGNAVFDTKNNQTIITINQFFLFSKLGHQYYFATPELYQEISFNKLMKCCSHELAHYLQFSKGRQSSCQSD
jgi:hypothetical protein